MQALLDKIKQEVFTRRPVLLGLLEQFGNKSLKDYVVNCWQVPSEKPNELFLNVFKKQGENLYGKDVTEAIIKQLTNKPLVSTIDHLGIWNHPIFVNSSLIYSLHFKPNEFAVVLATESVSLNNTSSWSGSLLLHDQLLKQQRYSFFPDKLKTLPVFSAPGLVKKNLELINEHSKELFIKLFEKLNVQNLSSGLNFSLQSSILSSRLWELVFPSAPKLIYIPLESLIAEYLLEVLNNPEHLLAKLINRKDLWQKYYGQDHTFMFWGIDIKGRRKSLPELPENYMELLSLRKIYPSSTLCYIALLDAGIACVGGFTQTTWLTEIKEKLSLILKDLSMSASHIEVMPTKNFAESTLALLKIQDNIINPTSLDLFFQNKGYYSTYFKLAETLTFEQSLNLAIPTIYSVVVPKAEQDPSINLEEIEKSLIKDYKIQDLL